MPQKNTSRLKAALTKQARDVLADVDFDALTANHIEPVYKA